MTAAGPLYECKVDIGPHFFIPRLEGLQVWDDRLIFQRDTSLQIPFSAIDKVELKNWWGNRVILLHYKDFIGNMQRLRFADSNRVTPNNAKTQLLHSIMQKAISEHRDGVAADAVDASDGAPRPAAERVPIVQQAMEAQAQKEVQSWGIGFIIAGALSLVAGAFVGLNPIWGLFLLIIGLIAWRTREVPWLVIIGLAIWWAALNNLTVGSERWTSTSLFQVLIGGAVLYRYAANRKLLQAKMAEMSPVAGRWLPWLSLIGGFLALFLFVAAILAYGLSESETAGNVLVAFVSPLTVLGVGAGLANLLSFKSHRLMSVVGLALGLIVIAVITLLALA